MERTWEAIADESGEPIRWNMFQNGKLIEGAYIEKVAQGEYGLHFPRLEYRTVPSLPVARAIMQDAPLLKRRGIAIGHRSNETDREAFVTLDEAAELLGSSRPRVSAMVANGVLSAAEFDGEVLVSRKSVARRNEAGETCAPMGRFANQFVQYFPDSSVNEFYLAEVDGMNSRAVQAANEFVEAIQGNDENKGGARLVGYKSAMRLRGSKHLIADESDQQGVISLARMCQMA